MKALAYAEPTPPPFVHPTALIEAGVEIGHGTSIWDNVHIRSNTRIGSYCIVGEKTAIAYDVVIGNYVKINAQVYICTGITVADRVMISAGVVFTNDRFPRAFADDGLASSAPNEDTLRTTVHEGATLGARAVIGPGIEIGKFAMIGMGAVVTQSIPPFALAYGSPARVQGWVCVCGQPLRHEPRIWGTTECGKCSRTYVARPDGNGNTSLRLRGAP